MIPIVYKYGRISTFDMYASALYLNKNIPYFHASWSSGCCEVAAGDGSGFPPDNVCHWLEKWVQERSKLTNRWCSLRAIESNCSPPSSCTTHHKCLPRQKFSPNSRQELVIVKKNMFYGPSLSLCSTARIHQERLVWHGEPWHFGKPSASVLRQQSQPESRLATWDGAKVKCTIDIRHRRLSGLKSPDLEFGVFLLYLGRLVSSSIPTILKSKKKLCCGGCWFWRNSGTCFSREYSQKGHFGVVVF